MGIHHSGDSGGPPPDGDLPPLPAEWGEITIPDDASALAAEAEQVRRELAAGRLGASQRAGRPDGDSRRAASGQPRFPGAETSVAAPLLIMSVAVLITLISLFAMTWSGTTAPDPSGAATGHDPPATLPALALTDATGRPVALAAYQPLALLVVEECVDCAELIASTVTAAPPGVTVAAVGHTAPAWPPGLDPAADSRPLLLADPDGTLRTLLALDPPANAATVILVDADGQLTRTLPAATGLQQFRADLTELGARQPAG